MCRFVAYKGNEILMSDLLTTAEHSLLVQSYAAKKREGVNGDGFGIAWYPLHNDPAPGVFTSILPAWAERNLHRLADKIISRCFFAHVRDATPGLPVTELNSHPFRYGKMLFMHNGYIANFKEMKRQLRAELSDYAYHKIDGNTDSEHLFALILSELGDNNACSLEQLQHAVFLAFSKLEHWNKKNKVKDPSYLNITMTDGQIMLATRYVSNVQFQAASLFVSSGNYHMPLNEKLRIIDTKHAKKETVVIASEPLTGCQDDWVKVERNHFVAVDRDNHLTVSAMPRL